MMHDELSKIAVRWLKRPQSSGGHGCHIAVSEVRTGWSGEVPDAIGFRACGDGFDGSIVVEVKVSRSDFLADRKKPHRQEGSGCGNWRYFMCPEGMIAIDELPPGWGLLEVNTRRHVKPIAGAAAYFKGHYGVLIEQLVAWRHLSDSKREQWLLVKLLARVGDAEEVNRKIKSALGEQSRLIGRVNEQTETIRKLRFDLYQARHAVSAADCVS